MIWDSVIWLWNWSLWKVLVTKITLANTLKRGPNKNNSGWRKRGGYARGSSSLRYPCKQHCALNSFQCWGVNQIAANLQFKWTLCEQVLYFQQFRAAMSDYQGVLHCEEYNFEEYPDEIMEVPSSEPFFTRRMKLLSRPDGFMMYVKVGADFLSTSDLLYPNNKTRLRLIRVGADFSINSDNPNVSLWVVQYSLYTRRVALKEDYHEKRIEMSAHTLVKYHHLETFARTFTIPARQYHLLQEINFNNAPDHRIIKLCIRWIVFWKPILVATIQLKTN